MEEFQLIFDSRIPKLEKANRWRTVVDIVYEQWNNSPSELNCLLCAGTQIWYTLLVMDYIKSTPLPPDDVEFVQEALLQKKLMDVTHYGFKHFINDPMFNAYFGYMLSVTPYLFLDHNGDYLELQAKGIEMMRYSHRLDPNSPLTKAMYYETEGWEKNTPFYYACKEIWSKITPTQWGNSEVQQYFFRILHGEDFCLEAYS